MAMQKTTLFEIEFTNEYFKNINKIREHFPDVGSKTTKTIELTNAYFMIGYLEATKDEVSFELVCYKDDSKELIITTNRYSYKPDLTSEHTPNFYAQGYLYLKNLPEFYNAADV